MKRKSFQPLVTSGQGFLLVVSPVNWPDGDGCYPPQEVVVTNYTPDEYRIAHPENNVLHAFDMANDIACAEYHQQRRFNEYCGMYGFTPEDYGTTFRACNGRMYRFVGFRTENYRYPCICTSTDTDQPVHALKVSASYMARVCCERNAAMG